MKKYGIGNMKMRQQKGEGCVVKANLEQAFIAGKNSVVRGLQGIKREAMKTDPGIDGILVTVGLCVIALLLCLVMKSSLSTFISSIVTDLTTEAQKILNGTRVS